MSNPVLHLRMTDRRGEDGAKLLHIEELQSDWGQKGHTRGFQNPADPDAVRAAKMRTDAASAEVNAAHNHASKLIWEDGKSEDHPDVVAAMQRQNAALAAQDDAETHLRNIVGRQTGIFPAPYVTHASGWTDLGLKRALLEAAKHGHDRLVVSDGDTVADHYGQRHRVDRAEYDPEYKELNIYDDMGRHLKSERVDHEELGHKKFFADEVAPHIGKHAAEEMAHELHERGLFDGEHDDDEGDDERDHVSRVEVNDIRHAYGGEGLLNHYDKIVPKRLLELVRQHDKSAKIEWELIHHPEDERGNTETHVRSVKITPEMRRSILRHGFKAYKRGGDVERTPKQGGGSLGPNSFNSPQTLGDLVDVHTDPDENAAFYMVRRGSPDKVGMPTREHSPHHYGVYVKRPDVIDPNYLYYMMQHLHNQGAFKQVATGSTGLVNIRKEHITGIPLARQGRADGGANMPRMPAPQKEKLHVGPIHSPVAGRTDHLPMHVPSGSYVIPADIISAMGEGNTMAGFKHMRRIFGGAPYGGSGLPYSGKRGLYGQNTNSPPYGATGGPYGQELPGRASGGEHEGSVPIVAAGGEYVLSPDEVRFAGGGDLDAGHRVLDDFVKRYRAQTIKTLSKLPGPKKD